jgi:hypothetical protein
MGTQNPINISLLSFIYIINDCAYLDQRDTKVN